MKSKVELWSRRRAVRGLLAVNGVTVGLPSLDRLRGSNHVTSPVSGVLV